MSAESSMLHHVRARHRLDVLRVRDKETQASLSDYKMGVDGGSNVPKGVIFTSADPEEHRILDEGLMVPIGER